MVKLCLAGGLGRMGRVIAGLVEAREDMEIVSVFEMPQAIRSVEDYGTAVGYTRGRVTLTSDAQEAAAPADVVVDFTLPSAFDAILEAAETETKPLVTGTTGIVDKEARLEALAAKVPVVSAPNMSVGMNVVFALCRRLAGVMGENSDIEIVETHHRTKKDIPSGTAREIAKILSDRTAKPVAVGRSEGTSMRGKEIAIHSLRAGDVPGSHTVVFAPEGETLEISHSARSRICFAEGALRAARFVMGSPPGLYDMLDVLGLGIDKEA
jgi:4-hydroxy-tetrahydrodipicolinate reductase